MSVASNRVGAAFLINFGDWVRPPIDAISRVPGQWFTAQPGIATTVDGLSTNFVAASNHVGWQWPATPLNSILGPITILWRGIFASVTDYRALVSKCLSVGNTQTNYDARIDITTGNVAFGRANTAYKLWSAPTGCVPGTVYTICISAQTPIESTPSIVMNGVSYTPTGSGSGTGAATDSTTGMIVGMRQDGVGKMDGTVRLVGLWNRAMTVAEQIALTLNPYTELGLAPQREQILTNAITAAPPGRGGPLLLMGVGGMIAAAGGKLLIDNPTVTRRQILTGGQDGND